MRPGSRRPRHVAAAQDGRRGACGLLPRFLGHPPATAEVQARVADERKSYVAMGENQAPLQAHAKVPAAMAMALAARPDSRTRRILARSGEAAVLAPFREVGPVVPGKAVRWMASVDWAEVHKPPADASRARCRPWPRPQLMTVRGTSCGAQATLGAEYMRL